MTDAYSLDTNALLMAHYETYRPASFPGFWKRLDELVAEGRAVVCEEVKIEIERKDDEVAAWLKDHAQALAPLDDEQLILARQLAKQFPTLAKERLGRRRADGFVIALAQQRGLVVVTHENGRGPDKIPNICEATSVRCVSLADLIAAEGWTF